MAEHYRWMPLMLLAASLCPRAAVAQSIESAGNRAAGMSAFVGVADDGSAVLWNPAGLATGSFFNLAIDLGRTHSAPSSQPRFPGRAARDEVTFVSVGIPPFGLSYYRTTSGVLTAASPAGQLSPNRQDYQVSVRSLVTDQFGASLVQSLTEHVVVAATAKVVHGASADSGTSINEWSDGFEYAESLDTRGSTTGDLDLGAMFALGHVHAGVVARNITEPTFDVDGGPSLTLERHVRVGGAWGDRWPGVPNTTIAFDADITKTMYASGERRDIAAGIEHWLAGRRLGVRAGFRASTFGETRPVGSVGGSFSIRGASYVDAFYAKGRDEDRAWGVGFRVTY